MSIDKIRLATTSIQIKNLALSVPSKESKPNCINRIFDCVKKAFQAIAAFFQSLFCKKKKMPDTAFLPPVPLSSTNDAITPKKNTLSTVKNTDASSKDPLVSQLTEDNSQSSANNPFPNLPRALSNHIASFLDGRSQINFANSSVQLHQSVKPKSLILSPRQRNLFENWDKSKTDEYEHVEEIVFEEHIQSQIENGKKSWYLDKRFVGSLIAVDSLIAAGKKGAFPKLKSISFDFPAADIENITIPSSLLQTFPKLENVRMGNNHKVQEAHFDALAANCPCLKEVVFSPLETFAPSPEKFRKWLKSWPQLISITCTTLTDEQMTAIIEECPQIKEIYLTKRCVVSEEKIIELLARCNEIEKLGLYFRSGHFTNKTLNALSRCPNLKEVDLDLTSVSDEDIIDLLATKAQFPLTSLTVRTPLDLSENALITLFNKFHGIKHFNAPSINFNAPITKKAMLTLAINNPHLKQLTIAKRENEITEKEFQEIIRRLPNIELLFIKGDFPFSDALLNTIAESCPKLRFLSLPFQNRFNVNKDKSKVTVNGLRALGRKCPGLQFINYYDLQFNDGYKPTLQSLKKLIPSLTSYWNSDIWYNHYPIPYSLIQHLGLHREYADDFNY